MRSTARTTSNLGLVAATTLSFFCTHPAVAQDVLRSVVLIERRTLSCTTGEDCWKPAGSGFFSTPDGLIVTAEHVVTNSDANPDYTWQNFQFRVRVANAYEVPRDVTVLETNAAYDLACLFYPKGPVEDTPYLAMGLPEATRPRDRVFAAGFSGPESTLALYAGDVVLTTVSTHPGKWLMVVPGLMTGDSGGPVLDENERAIAIVSEGAPLSTRHYAAPFFASMRCLRYAAATPDEPESPAEPESPVEPEPEDPREAGAATTKAWARREIQELMNSLLQAGFEPGGVVDSTKVWRQSQIPVCFMDGSPALRRHVAEVADQWTYYGAIDFDFGSLSEPRLCGPEASGFPVRITLSAGQGGGFWSYVGTDALNVSVQSPTMSLPLREADPNVLSGEADRYILHEFGHVLGLHHVSLHPDSACAAAINWTAAYEYFARLGWSRAVVDRNLRLQPNKALNIGAFDAASIMQYHLPAEIFSEPNSGCSQASAGELSVMDKLAMGRTYPTPGTQIAAEADVEPAATLDRDPPDPDTSGETICRNTLSATEYDQCTERLQ